MTEMANQLLGLICTRFFYTGGFSDLFNHAFIKFQECAIRYIGNSAYCVCEVF